MLETFRWISFVLNLVALALNLTAFIIWLRLNKKLKAREKELDATAEYCATMINACTEFLEAELKEEGQNESSD